MKKRKFTAKRLFAVILSVLLALSAVPFSVTAGTKTAPVFPIATVSDIHYYPESLAGSKGEAFYSYVDGSMCVYGDLDAMLDASLESLKYQIKNEGLKYVVLVGDLTTNGEYEGHRALAEKLRAFKAETGCEIYVTNGNHDINNYDASSFVNNVREQAKITTPSDFVDLYHDLGFEQAYHRYKGFGDGTQGSLTYSVQTPEGYRLILADGGKYTADATEAKEDSKETSGAFTAQQTEWILAEAADAKENGEIPLLFTHWNISGMNYFHEFLLQGFVIDDAYMLQEAFADAGIHYVFSGHQHVADVDVTYSDKGEPMYSVINPTLTQFPFAYRVTTFRTNENGGLDVDFDLCDVDEHSAVRTESGTGSYPAPYRLTGFGKEYSGPNGASDFLWRIVKKLLDKYMGDIRAAGSVVEFLKSEFDLDLNAVFNDLLYGGITVGSINITSENLMGLVDDIDYQLMQNFIYPKSQTYALIRETLKDVCAVEFSDVPCTKFIDTYGFGDESRGGTLGDFILTVLVYLYGGNEDISDDAFAQDLLKQSESPEFVDKIFSMAVEHIVQPLVVDEILAKTELHLDALFKDKTGEGATYTQTALVGLVAILDNFLFATSDEADLFSVISRLGTNLFDISLRRLAETVLETGLVPYGDSINGLCYGLLDNFFDADAKQATAYQLNVLLDGVFNDADKDYGVTYSYNGPEEVTPTAEDMQLPSYLSTSFGSDASGGFTVTWFTKYSVKGTDILFADGSVHEFTAKTEETELTGFGFDFGPFGILPWTRSVVKHQITVTGLDAGTRYVFTVGDKEKGFMSDNVTVKTSKPGEDIAFIAVSGTACVTPAQGGKAGALLADALKKAPDAAFLVNAGDVVREADNTDRWGYVLNGCAQALRSLPVIAAPGANDTETFIEFLHNDYPRQLDDSGVFCSVNYGDVHITTLNVNNIISGGSLSAEQLKWLRTDLSANTAPWTVIVLNGSLYGAEETDETLRKQLLGYLQEYDADLILQGGKAYYGRTGMLTADGEIESPAAKTMTVNGKSYNVFTENSGFIALTPGNTAAAPAQEAYSHGENGKALTGEGFYSVIRVTDGILTVDTYAADKNGTTAAVDSFGMIKELFTVMPGDVTLDSKITVDDARLALRFAIGFDDDLSDLQAFNCGVANGKTVTVNDARLILRAAIGLESIKPSTVTVTMTEISAYADAVRAANGIV